MLESFFQRSRSAGEVGGGASADHGCIESRDGRAGRQRSKSRAKEWAGRVSSVMEEAREWGRARALALCCLPAVDLRHDGVHWHCSDPDFRPRQLLVAGQWLARLLRPAAAPGL